MLDKKYYEQLNIYGSFALLYVFLAEAIIFTIIWDWPATYKYSFIIFVHFNFIKFPFFIYYYPELITYAVGSLTIQFQE